MPFQPGNPGGGKRKEKLFHTALCMELKAAGEHMPELRQIARRLIGSALSDHPLHDPLPAIKEIANRLDGTPAQTVEVSGEQHTYVHRSPEPTETTEEWASEHSSPTVQ
jgi:hypothetical protein